MVFQFNGLIDGALIGRNGIPSWLYVVVVLLVFLFFDGRRNMRFDKYSILFFMLFLSCLPSFIEYYDLFSFSVFSIVICILLSSVFRVGWTLTVQNKMLIYNAGVLIALLSIAMFLYFSVISRPVFGVDSIRPGFGYAIDRGVLIRLVGFADDPNFYVLGMILPLLIGMSEPKFKYRKIGLILISLSLVLTFSRSGLLAVIFGTGAFYFRRISVKLALGVIVVGLLSLALGLVYGLLIEGLKTSQTTTVDRSFSGGFDSRSNLLVLAMEKEDLKYFGNGIGRAKDAIGLHSHNSYFDYIFDAGLVPFAILLLIIIFFVLDSFFKSTILSAYTVSICVGAAALSIGFHPLFLLFLMASGRYGRAERI
jgi:hypothetical protein